MLQRCLPVGECLCFHQSQWWRTCPAHLGGDQNSLVFRPFKPECFLNMSLLTPANRPLSMLVESFADALRGEINTLLERSLTG
ncbi:MULTISPECIES: hypothetical protein [unclassified Labrenzia]|uniref:hypothetical protein n=1 Tax=unclassified Labrenzia TaxID=2648686 RepID=UPI001267E5FB|nr:MULTISPECIES: hypothetical protein [unclassified Labrenzia]